jgi:hypothetical protein
MRTTIIARITIMLLSIRDEFSVGVTVKEVVDVEVMEVGVGVSLVEIC